MDEKRRNSKRRGRGEGSIFQRGDGRWVATVSSGFTANGRRRRQVLYGETKQAVQEKLRDAQTKGMPSDTTKLTVKEYLKRWLANTAKVNVAPTTYERYKGVVENQLIPHLGSIRLDRLQPLHVEQLYGDLGKADATPRTQQLAGVVLGAALRHAVGLKLIFSNPTREIRKPRVPRVELNVWSNQEASAFLKTTSNDRLHAMYVVALASGMRQGELFALHWSDIDFTTGCLTVQRSLEEINGALRLKEPKSGKGRKIELPPFALAAIQVHRAAMLVEGNIAGPVFCDSAGGYLRKGNVWRRSYTPLVKAAGVPVIRFHDLRHTHATLLLLDGENVKVVSERLGHSSIQITLDTYAHVLPSMQRAAADKLQRLLG